MNLQDDLKNKKITILEDNGEQMIVKIENIKEASVSQPITAKPIINNSAITTKKYNTIANVQSSSQITDEEIKTTVYVNDEPQELWDADSKIDTSSIADNCKSTDSKQVLAAAQGKVLMDLINEFYNSENKTITLYGGTIKASTFDGDSVKASTFDGDSIKVSTLYVNTIDLQ